MSEEDKSTENVRLWHGGAAGRKVGDELLPPVSTGFERTNAVLMGAPGRGKVTAYRRNLVYASDQKELAEYFAAQYTQDKDRSENGQVYEVELENPEPDQDLARMTSFKSFQARKGVIVAIGDEITNVTPKHAEYQKRIQAEGALVKAAREKEEKDRKDQEKAARDARRKAKRERNRARKLRP